MISLNTLNTNPKSSNLKKEEKHFFLTQDEKQENYQKSRFILIYYIAIKSLSGIDKELKDVNDQLEYKIKLIEVKKQDVVLKSSHTLAIASDAARNTSPRQGASMKQKKKSKLLQ